jgi:hypothetical protein
MKFFITMVEITRIITSSEISKEKISYLQLLIREYFHYRKIAFPLTKLIPKHNYIVHYPDLVKKFEPLLRTWTVTWYVRNVFTGRYVSNRNTNIFEKLHRNTL